MAEIDHPIYKMGLHEILVLSEVGPKTTVRRVPGGWIYTIEIWKDGTFMGCSSDFVPYTEISVPW